MLPPAMDEEARCQCRFIDASASRDGSVIETAVPPLDGFITGFMICGVIMLAGGLIGMALIHLERWTRWASVTPTRSALLEEALATSAGGNGLSSRAAPTAA